LRQAYDYWQDQPGNYSILFSLHTFLLSLKKKKAKSRKEKRSKAAEPNELDITWQLSKIVCFFSFEKSR